MRLSPFILFFVIAFIACLERSPALDDPKQQAILFDEVNQMIQSLQEAHYISIAEPFSIKQEGSPLMMLDPEEEKAADQQYTNREEERQREISEQGSVRANEQEALQSSNRIQLEELIHRLIATISQQHQETYASLTTAPYKEANAAWDELLLSRQNKTKAERTKKDKQVLHNQAEELLKKIQDAKKNNETTFLKRVADIMGQAAIPLSYVPGPVPLGGIAHTVSAIAEQLDEIWNTLHEKAAEAAATVAELAARSAENEATAATHKINEAREAALKKETFAKVTTTLALREAAQKTFPSLKSFEEDSWHHWAQSLIQQGKEDNHWIQPLVEHAMIDPAWAATTVSTAWEKISQQVQQLPSETEMRSLTLKEAAHKSEQNYRTADVKFFEAKKNADHQKNLLRLALEDYQSLVPKLEELHTAWNQLRSHYCKGYEEKLKSTENSFFEKLQSLQENCSIINNFEKKLSQLLNEQARQEEKTLLAHDHYDAQQQALKRHEERIRASQQNPLLGETPFRLPARISEEETLSEKYLSAPTEHPAMLGSVATLLGKKQEAIFPKTVLIPEIKKPTEEDRTRWEMRKKVERLREAKEQAATLYHQYENEQLPLPEPIRSGSTASFSATHHFLRHQSGDDTDTRSRSQSTSSSSSFFSTRSRARSQMSFVGNQVTEKEKGKILKEQLEEAAHVFVQAQEELTHKVTAANQARGTSYSLEAWEKADQRAEQALHEQEQMQQQIAQAIKGAAEYFYDWEESTQRWEMRWDAQQRDTRAHERWSEMAEKKICKTLLREDAQFAERLALGKEKLQEQDTAITSLWEKIQALYKKTTQEELLKQVGSLRNTSQQRLDEDRDGYRYILDQMRDESVKKYFQQADQIFKNGNDQSFEFEEKKAHAAYAKAARFKALEDAEQKTPGATIAWKHRLEQAKKATQNATISERHAAILQSEEEAFQLFLKADQEFDQLEKIWIAQLQHEKRAVEITTWKAATDFLIHNNRHAWDQLPINEKANYNGNVLEANRAQEQAKIQKIYALLHDTHKAVEDLENVFSAWAWVTIGHETHLVNGELKQKLFEHALKQWSNFRNYLNELTAEEKDRATCYQKNKTPENAIYPYSELQQERELGTFKVAEITNRIEKIKPAFYPTIEKKLKANVEKLQNKAAQATSLAGAAHDKAWVISGEEADPLWDEAIEKRKESETAWNETLKALEQSLTAVPIHREDLANWWKTQIENAETAKNQASALRVLYMIKKAERLTGIAHDKAGTASDEESIQLWDDAIEKRNASESAWDQALKAAEQALVALPIHREGLVKWWKTQIENAEIAKNKASAWSVRCVAYKVVTIAHLARDKAKAASDEESIQLWDDAIEKRNASESAWNEALKACEQSLAAVPIHRADLAKWWKTQIENVKDDKNQTSALRVLYMSNKADSITNAAYDKACAISDAEAGPLWDEAIEKRHTSEIAKNEALKAFEQGLMVVPIHREDLASWWKTNLEFAKNAKNQLSALRVLYMANKVSSIANVARGKAAATSDEESIQLWDEAIETRKASEKTWDELLKALEEGLAAVPVHREDLVNWWKTQSESAENAKNQAFALNIRYMVNKANSIAYIAREKAAAASAAEAGPLWDNAIEKIKESEGLWNEALKALEQGLAAIPIHREDLANWWKTQIKKAENAKNETTTELTKLISQRALAQEKLEE